MSKTLEEKLNSIETTISEMNRSSLAPNAEGTPCVRRVGHTPLKKIDEQILRHCMVDVKYLGTHRAFENYNACVKGKCEPLSYEEFVKLYEKKNKEVKR